MYILNSHHIMFNESNRDHKFTLRMTAEEYEVIKSAAEAAGVTVAKYIRQATYEKIKQTQPELVASTQ